jgi:hypothetical protein
VAEELLTLKDIARRLNMAESTARYFRDKWPEYIPAVKVGRRTFYQPEAVQVIKTIAEETQKRKSAAETQSRLNSMFAVNIEPAAETQRNNATEQQSQYLTDKTNLKALAQANKEIIYLRGIIERLLRQNQELAGRVMQLEPVKSSERRPGLLKRIFKGNS